MEQTTQLKAPLRQACFGVLVISSAASRIDGDDWDEGQQTEIEDGGPAPVDDRKSAIAADLTPGGYAAIVRGKDKSSVIGLMEVCNQ